MNESKETGQCCGLGEGRNFHYPHAFLSTYPQMRCHLIRRIYRHLLCRGLAINYFQWAVGTALPLWCPLGANYYEKL